MGSAAAAVALAILAIKLKDKEYPQLLVKLASCSTGIYIFHKVTEPFIKVFCGFIFGSESKVSGYVMPIFVCIAATFLSLLFNLVTKKLKMKHNAR